MNMTCPYLQFLLCWILTVNAARMTKEKLFHENAEILDIAHVTINQHRVKRGTTDVFETMYLQSALNSESSIIIQLKTNKNILINNIEWRSKNRLKHWKYSGSNCNFLDGTLEGTDNSSASLVHCGNRVSGIIMNPNNTTPIFIEPWNITGTHVLYRINLEKKFDVSSDQHFPSTFKRIRRLAYSANITEISPDDYKDDDYFLEDLELLDDLTNENISEESELGSGLLVNDKQKKHRALSNNLEEMGYMLDTLWEQETIAEWRSVQLMSKMSKKLQPQRWLKLALTVDHSVIEFHGRDHVELYVLSLMNIVSAVYKDPSLDSNLRLAIVKLLFLEDEEDCKVVAGSSKASLESVNRWNAEEAQGTSSDSPMHSGGTKIAQRDAAIWLTRVDLGGPSGYAPVSGVCDPARSCTLNRDEGLTSAFIISHELGHVLGFSHDGDLAMGNNCTTEAQKGSVMAAMVSATFHRFHWSPCSRSEFHAKADTWGCLNKRPFGSDTKVLNSLINASFSMDEQCRMEFGEGFSLCRSFELPMPCAYLWCSHDSAPQICRTKKGPPLEGTECGPNHWCVSGMCEEMDTEEMVASLGLAPVLHNSRDGGWGPWSEWQPCSRTCDFGVSFRTRACDTPIPQYGGANCHGRSEEFRICVTQPCKRPLRDLRAEQCNALFLSSRKFVDLQVKAIAPHNNTKMLWMPIEMEEERLKCHLTCINRDNGKKFRTSEHLIDGTPCSYDQSRSDICIQGVCHMVGCNGDLGSNLQKDLCGVCGGNNSQCHNATNYVSKLIRRAVTKISVLPQGARQIVVKIRHKDTYRLKTKPAVLSVVAGSKFRIESSRKIITVSAKGPLLSEIILMASTDEEQHLHRLRLNANVTYVMHLSDMKRAEYYWELGGWGPCSASCGGAGQQQRTLACRHSHSGRLVPRKHCSLLSKPSTLPTKTCNAPKCFFSWEVGPWEHCSRTCGSRGQSHREVYCSASNDSRKDAVHPSLCINQPKPTMVQTCNKIACPVHWEIGNWMQCSVTCGKGVARRDVRCSAPRGEPLFRCGPSPPDMRHCNVQTCSATERCDNFSHFCQLPLLYKYCVLPIFQQICCTTCSGLKTHF